MNKSIILVACLALCLVLIGIVSAKSECEIKRTQQEKSLRAQERNGGGTLAILVPKCNADGSYAQLQCHSGSDFCQCWDKEGIPLTAPKNKLTKCTCLVDRAKQLKSIPPSQTDIPEMTSCEKDGSYTKRQCDRTACWCVNQDSGAKITKENKNKSSVKC